MNDINLKKFKSQCLEEIRSILPVMRATFDSVDPRLYLYISDAVREDMDTANVFELLGIRKVIRLMHTYELNIERVKKWLVAIEGVWEDGKHIGGGLKFDTPRGAKHVPLMTYQVWCVFGIFAFDIDVDMQKEYIPGIELLPSEFVKEGKVYDKRRLITEAHLFQTRKSGKTEFGGALDFVEANVLGPLNSQVLICANTKDQAKIAFKAITAFSYQLDPASTNKAGGKYLRVTADETTWRPGKWRTSEIKVMSAGGKKKDGLYASWVHADEHGSASYTNGHSDMQDLVEVCAGSMGPRREQMLIHTTTAGLVNEGPYQLQLRGVEERLVAEMDIPLGTAKKTDDDEWFALLLRLDPWDFDGNVEKLDQENLFRKVNRSIGVTVQPTWYKKRIHDALTKGDDTKREVLTKDFNIWQADSRVDWIRGEDIRKIQKPMKIEDCKYDDGWVCFCGLDFSMGNDLHAASYLAVRNNDDGTVEFFADMDSWISEETLSETPMRPLFEKWIEKGDLHVSPGSTLEPTLPVQRIAELEEAGVVFLGFGYDSYKAKTPINALSAWVVELTGDVKAPKDYIVPVSQTYASYNPVVEEMDYMVKSSPSLITFSMNSMWPWQFNNCVLDVDVRYENKKPVKRSLWEKVDNVQALLSALMMYDRAEGREMKE